MPRPANKPKKSVNAPLYVDSAALCVWLQQRLAQTDEPLPRAVCVHALRLHDCILLALENHRREYHVMTAQEVAAVLRAALRLADELGYLSTRQLLYALDCMDTISRQLNGWRRALVRGDRPTVHKTKLSQHNSGGKR